MDKKEIERLVDDLKEAYIEFVEARDRTVKCQLAEQKAHKKLSLARQAVGDIRTNFN